MTDNGSALGELIQVDSREFVAECHTLYAAPPFGTFVRAECIGSGVAHYAVVTRIATGPVDSNRVVQAHRLPPGELEARKPHLTSLFRTIFEARAVGYGRDGAVLPGTAPLPPRLHCFVYPASAEEVRALTARPDFLRPLTLGPEELREDLLVAAIQSARGAWGDSVPLLAWARYLARLLRREYVTLESVFQRLGADGAAPPVRASTGETGAVPPALRPGIPTPRPADGAPRWEERRPLIAGDVEADPFSD